MSHSTHESSALVHGNDAALIIEKFRKEADEYFSIDTLDREFPYYADLLGNHAVYLADASNNAAGTFKWRGAVVGAMTLAERGGDMLVVPSAGNHARGSVIAAKLLQMPIHVVVPRSAPEQKSQGIRELWDDPRLRISVVGDSFDESLAWAYRQEGTLLHPFGDEVIPGQGTIVDDILTEKPDTSMIVLPVGGGGLAAGVLKRLGEVGRTDIHVTGVEASGSNSMSRSLASSELSSIESPNARYGGSAVQTVGRTAFEICRHSQQFDVVSVTENEVDELIDQYEQGRQDLWRATTRPFEPTSLVAIAALRRLERPKNTVVIGTGKNDVLQQHRPTRRYRVPT